MVLVHCILGSFLGVGCHCFPPPLDVPTFASRCLHVQATWETSINLKIGLSDFLGSDTKLRTDGPTDVTYTYDVLFCFVTKAPPPKKDYMLPVTAHLSMNTRHSFDLHQNSPLYVVHEQTADHIQHLHYPYFSFHIRQAL